MLQNLGSSLKLHENNSYISQETPFYGATVRIHETVGVVGIACPDESPLLAFVSLLAPAVIRGNAVVVIPSEKHPMVAVDMYQVSNCVGLTPGGGGGVVCPDESPLLAFVSLLAPAVIRGNALVVIPSEKHPMVAVDMYQVSNCVGLTPGGRGGGGIACPDESPLLAFVSVGRWPRQLSGAMQVCRGSGGTSLSYVPVGPSSFQR